jgi:hypothetical protein
MHSVLHAFTHSVVWASALASAFVAIVTTLVVEYIAKPGLEARKERILEDRRQQRKVLRNLDRCTFLAGRLIGLAQLKPGEYDQEIMNAQKDEAGKMVAEIEGIAVNTFEVMNVPAWIDDDLRKTIGAVGAFSLGLKVKGHAPKEAWGTFDSATDRLDDFIALFATSKWHALRRRKLIRKIKSSPLYTEALNDRNRYREENASVSSSHQDETA